VLQNFSMATSVILDPLVTLWNSFVTMLPGIIGALIILIVGYFVAFLIGHALKVLLEKAGLNKWLYSSKVSKAIGHTNVSSLLVFPSINCLSIIICLISPLFSFSIN